MNETTTIFLTDEDAKLFLDYKKNQTEFMILKANGIFSTKNGSVTIHYDGAGTVRKVESNKVLFKA